MIALEQRAEGVILPVRARAGARRNGITGEHNGSLEPGVVVVRPQFEQTGLGCCHRRPVALLGGPVDGQPQPQVGAIGLSRPNMGSNGITSAGPVADSRRG